MVGATEQVPKSELHRLRLEAKMTQQELASRLQSSTGREWDQSKVSRYEANPDDAPHWAVVAMMEELGANTVPLGSQGAASEVPGLDPGDPLLPLRRDLGALLQYVDGRDWTSPDPTVSVPSIGDLRELCVQLERKPRLALFGKFDVGKSTLVNMLLGSKSMPTSYQPATRVATFVRHIDERPEWLKEDVLMLGEGFDPDRWSEEQHCIEFKVVAGGIETLHAHGSHRGAHKDSTAVYALVYVDAPILKACTIIDLPGTDNDTTDTERAEAKQIAFEIAIFADTATSFLNEGTLLRLGDVVRRLPPVEALLPSIQPLGNLFIVATHAHRDISTEQLDGEILQGGFERAWRQLGATTLSERAKTTGCRIDEAQFRARFFPFYRDIPERREALVADLRNLLAHTMPAVLRKQAYRDIVEFRDESCEELQATIDFYRRRIQDRAAIEAEYEELKKQEPQLRKVMKYARQTVESAIAQHKVEMSAEVSDYIRTRSSKGDLENLIREKFPSKKDAQQNAAALLMEEIQNYCEQQARERTEKVSVLVEEYIGEYAQASMGRQTGPGRTGIPFNAKGAFAGGLAGLASVGGLALWASTLGNLGAYIIVAKTVSVVSALGISTGGTAAWTAAVAAVGGPVTIAIGIVILAGVLGWALLRGSWQGRLAGKISSELSKRKVVEAYQANIEQYWDDTATAFAAGADSTEKAWDQHLADLAKLIAETDLEVLGARLDRLEELHGSFERLPWTETPQGHLSLVV